jgi:hypothetical protein
MALEAAKGTEAAGALGAEVVVRVVVVRVRVGRRVHVQDVVHLMGEAIKDVVHLMGEAIKGVVHLMGEAIRDV